MKKVTVSLDEDTIELLKAYGLKISGSANISGAIRAMVRRLSDAN